MHRLCALIVIKKAIEALIVCNLRKIKEIEIEKEHPPLISIRGGVVVEKISTTIIETLFIIQIRVLVKVGTIGVVLVQIIIRIGNESFQKREGMIIEIKKCALNVIRRGILLENVKELLM